MSAVYCHNKKRWREYEIYFIFYIRLLHFVSKAKEKITDLELYCIERLAFVVEFAWVYISLQNIMSIKALKRLNLIVKVFSS